MDKKEKMIILKCECGCSMLVAERSEWNFDGVDYIDYDISVQDSRYDHNYTTFFGRLKSAMKILFGKPIYYSDVYINDPKKLREFAEELKEMCLETKSEE